MIDFFFRLLTNLLIFWPYYGIVKLIRYLNKEKPPPPRPLPTNPRQRTQEALNMLRLARKHMDDANNLGDPFTFEHYMMVIEDAAKALERAKALDPNVTLLVEDKDFKHLYTLDDLASEALYMEAIGYKHKLYETSPPLEMNSFRWKEKMRADAVKTLDQALAYQPKNVMYLREKANFLWEMGNRREARFLIEQALKISPNDLDTLQMRDSFG